MERVNGTIKGFCKLWHFQPNRFSVQGAKRTQLSLKTSHKPSTVDLILTDEDYQVVLKKRLMKKITKRNLISSNDSTESLHTLCLSSQSKIKRNS